MVVGQLDSNQTGGPPPSLFVPTGRKKDWELTQAAFDMLLGRLDSDREEAGKKYEELRRKLVKFVGFWGCRRTEDLADETITRTASKIFAGETIENLNGYILGIARLAYKEMVRGEISQRKAMNRKPPEDGVSQAEEERRQKCYEQCLKRLPAEEQDLILKYYRGSKAPDREKLAKQMGISLNLLRVSAFRIRRKLGDCLQECLKQQPEI